jgi:hypothetical protein
MQGIQKGMLASLYDVRFDINEPNYIRKVTSPFRVV